MPDMKENWLPVTGYEGLYSVSDLGNVMSMDYANTGLLKILKPTKGRNGYLKVWLSKDRKQRSFSVHRLVMLAFRGLPPKGHEVNHISGDKADPRLVNLEYVTSSQNRIHAYHTGLQTPAHGENHCCAKLTAADILKIKEKRDSGMSQAEIAKEFGVNPSQISRILGGKRWIRTTALQ